MSISTIKSTVRSKMQALTNINNVKDWVIWTDSWQDIYDNFEEGGRIDTWMIGVSAANPNIQGRGFVKRPWMVNIFGIYSIKSSNKSSQKLENNAEAIMNEFSKSGSFLDSTIHAPMNMVLFENGIAYQQPIHRTQLQMLVTETVVVPFSCAG